jgi:hypothetical protein
LFVISCARPRQQSSPRAAIPPQRLILRILQQKCVFAPLLKDRDSIDATWPPTPQNPDRIHVHQLDVWNESDIEAVASAVNRRFGRCFTATRPSPPFLTAVASAASICSSTAPAFSTRKARVKRVFAASPLTPSLYAVRPRFQATSPHTSLRRRIGQTRSAQSSWPSTLDRCFRRLRGKLSV